METLRRTKTKVSSIEKLIRKLEGKVKKTLIASIYQIVHV